MEGLTGFAAFVHAAEQRSYVVAGRILGISASAVSKSVARLEERLGVRLLHRTTRSIGLTEEGTLLYERCKRVLDELWDAEATLMHSRERPRGRLRVNLPHVVGHHLLMAQLPEFTARFPEIELDIDFEDQVVDIVGGGLDVAVRSGHLPDTRLIARPIGEQHFVVCGSPAYFAHRGRPAAPNDLERHACIRFKYPSSGRLASWAFAPPHSEMLLPASLVFNNTDAGLAAAVHGLGLAHLPVYVAAPRIATGELQPVLTTFMVPFGSLWLVWPSNRQLSPKVRAFVDFVLEKLQAQPRAFQRVEESAPPSPAAAA
ncbi:LysR family transcriptional regulator [Variovorax sp. GB1R11]|uniref:LysR family transcriptional regulator n=1 Tax=Variovorax sp. GB1R11 TaxID=3443741 RepID=UPI003F45C9F1